MNTLIARLKDINPAKLIVERGLFNIDASSLAGIFVSNIVTGQGPEKITLDIMGQIPESQKSTSTQSEVQNFVDDTIVRLANDNLKASISPAGFIDDSRVIKKQFLNLEHGNLKQVNAIVLHRTDSRTAADTLARYKKRTLGTHFLIDNDGAIYQTASLNKKTQHVGPIRAKCIEQKTCQHAEKQTLGEIIKFGTRLDLHNHETKKNYPYRFPYNSDSLGIEVVGLYDEVKGYGTPSIQQLSSLKHLVTLLQNHYNLTNNDVYTHGAIAHKKESEGKFMGF